MQVAMDRVVIRHGCFQSFESGSDTSVDGTISFQSLSTMVTPPLNGQAAVSATKLFSTRRIIAELFTVHFWERNQTRF